MSRSTKYTAETQRRKGAEKCNFEIRILCVSASLRLRESVTVPQTTLLQNPHHPLDDFISTGNPRRSARRRPVPGNFDCHASAAMIAVMINVPTELMKSSADSILRSVASDQRQFQLFHR